ncbi:hypothetical protein VTN96DRAFT_7555 [Rasamsonia emersonii]
MAILWVAWGVSTRGIRRGQHRRVAQLHGACRKYSSRWKRPSGRNADDSVLSIAEQPWKRMDISGKAPVLWAFYTASGMSPKPVAFCSVLGRRNPEAGVNVLV